MKVSVLSWIVKKLRSCLAIVQDTDTATRNIAAGKYVIWKGSMKKALSAITQGDTLSSTNLGDVTDGVANEINSNLIPYVYESPALVCEFKNNSPSSFEIPEDGLYKFHIYASGSTAQVEGGFKIGNVFFYSTTINIAYGTWQAFIPMKKGTVITFVYGGGSQNVGKIYKV